MPEKWTGDLIGRMHNARVSFDDMANQLGVSKVYVGLVLNGRRNPPDAQKRWEGAFEAIMAARAAETN